MQVEFSVADLATVAGCGAVTLVLLQLVLKPLLAGLAGEFPSVKFEQWRPLAINGAALGVATVLAFVAQAVTGINFESGMQAFLTGLGGAMVATTGYEGIKNTIQVFR